MTKYLISNYDISINDEQADKVIKQGSYGRHRCGGCCAWNIMTEKPTSENVQNWCVEYNDEKYLYVFVFYGADVCDDESEYPLWNHLKELKLQGFGTVQQGNDIEYIYLTNEKIENFDHDEEYFYDIACNNADKAGGTVEFSDLS